MERQPSTVRRELRRNQRFSAANWALITSLIEQLRSPELIAGRLGEERRLRISHETIYRYVWNDRRRDATLYWHLRQAQKQRPKRRVSYDSRGPLAGERSIAQRPPRAENRSRIGHREGDTMVGSSDKHCIVALVDRKSGPVPIGKLAGRTVEERNRRASALIQQAPRRTFSLTLDNGTEFHGYKSIETATGATVYFTAPSTIPGSEERTRTRTASSSSAYRSA
jgi:IS30 family transposase